MPTWLGLGLGLAPCSRRPSRRARRARARRTGSGRTRRAPGGRPSPAPRPAPAPCAVRQPACTRSRPSTGSEEQRHGASFLGERRRERKIFACTRGRGKQRTFSQDFCSPGKANATAHPSRSALRSLASPETQTPTEPQPTPNRGRRSQRHAQSSEVPYVQRILAAEKGKADATAHRPRSALRRLASPETQTPTELQPTPNRRRSETCSQSSEVSSW